MAFAIGATPDVGVLSMSLESTTGDHVVKRTLLDGATNDATILEIAEDLDNLTNAVMIDPKFAGRSITGQKGSAVAALQNLVSAFMVLTFGKDDAISGKHVTKNFIVPAYVNTIATGSPPTPYFTTPGTGSLPARLARLIGNLEDNLAYKQADQTYANGGWQYEGGAFGTSNDYIDGE